MKNVSLAYFYGIKLSKTCCYLFMISLNRYKGSCKTLDSLWSRICAPNKTENVNLNNKNK